MLGGLHVDGAGPGAGPVAASDESSPRRCDRRSLPRPRQAIGARRAGVAASLMGGCGCRPLRACSGLTWSVPVGPPSSSCSPDPSVPGSDLRLPGLSLKQHRPLCKGPSRQPLGGATFEQGPEGSGGRGIPEWMGARPCGPPPLWEPPGAWVSLSSEVPAQPPSLGLHSRCVSG